MREIDKTKVGAALVELLDEEEPFERDIGILNGGVLVGVVISPGAYRFFLEKVELEQDIIDKRIIEELRNSPEGANDDE